MLKTIRLGCPKTVEHVLIIVPPEIIDNYSQKVIFPPAIQY